HNQSETDETNNVLARPITLTAPDLVVSDASAPASATVGQTFSVSWTVTNQGSIAAPTTWYDTVYLARYADAVSGPVLAQLRSGNSAAVAAGANSTLTTNVTMPNRPTGPSYLIFVADSNLHQGETDETNNTRAVPITLDAPDLVVTAAQGPDH